MKYNFIYFFIVLSVSFLFNLNSAYAQTVNEEIKEQILKKQIFKEEAMSKPIESIPEASNNIIDISKKEKAVVSQSFFGYDYFLQREVISLYNNLPIPNQYQLGPGDEIIINIWGNIQLQSSYVINRDGNVYIDKLGQFSIIGKTLLEAENYLKKRYETVFSSLGGNQPEAFLDLTIGRLKSINVNIIGEASSPGIHSLHPFSTISTALIQSGGIKSTGTLRAIKLIRDGEEIAELDFYKFLISAKQIDDFRLLDGDLIFIPLRFSTIKISGEVNRANIFELKRNENLANLLDYCGGLKISAQNNIEINRVVPINERKFEDFAYEALWIKSNDSNFLLLDGDDINVRSISNVDNYIDVVGIVKNPGRYPFIKGNRIMDIIEIAGGINDSSFINKMDIKNIELVRSDPMSEYPIKYSININTILNGDNSQNILLKNWDIITVRRNIYYDKPKRVIIKGEVLSPGNYTLLNSGETISDVIYRSGGYTDRANSAGIKVFRDNIQIILKDLAMPLKDGDEIIVPEYTSVVEISGEVFHPGFVEFSKGKKINYYVNSAGGYTYNANKNATMIIYPNGDVQVRSLFGFSDIKEGSKIIIQKKKEKEDFDITEFLKEATSILTNIITIIFVIRS